jgi:uncharacterized sodium:solute symporter family permease YidK
VVIDSVSDTLRACAQSNPVQEITVIIQALFVIIGALITLFNRRVGCT